MRFKSPRHITKLFLSIAFLAPALLAVNSALSASQTLTPIPVIQGASHRSPLQGRTVSTGGIVTRVNRKGFYLQAIRPDNNIASSEGIFVFTQKLPAIKVGDEVTITAIVDEYRGSRDDLTLTQLKKPSIIKLLSSGNPLPKPVVLGIGGRIPPSIIDDDALTRFEPLSDAIDFYESLEGMLVSIANPLVVGPSSRFGELWVLADSGVNAAHRNRRGGVTINENSFNPERIQVQLNRASTRSNRMIINVGDRLADIRGVLSYNFSNFEVLPIEPIVKIDGILTAETTQMIGSKHCLTIASFNLMNLDPNDADGDKDIANGRFDALGRQISRNLRSPDIIALQEIQDNNGSLDDGTVAASRTAQLLIDAIASSGGSTYRYIDADPRDGADGGQPGGNIRSAFLYNSERVKVDVNSVKPIVDTRRYAGDDFKNTRKPLVAEFEFKNQTIQLINVHLSSRSGSSPLFGNKQPAINANANKRNRQARLIKNFIDKQLSAEPNRNIILLGDFNEFYFNAALQVFKTGKFKLTNLMEKLPENERYSYNFEGNSQAMDHVLINNSLLNRFTVEFDIVQSNSEFANNSSDHDPIISRLCLNNPSSNGFNQ